MYFSESLFGVGLLGESLGGFIVESQQHKQYSYSLHYLGNKPQPPEQLLFIGPYCLFLQDKTIQNQLEFWWFPKG